jgi:hypothetical protein
MCRAAPKIGRQDFSEFLQPLELRRNESRRRKELPLPGVCAGCGGGTNVC